MFVLFATSDSHILFTLTQIFLFVLFNVVSYVLSKKKNDFEICSFLCFVWYGMLRDGKFYMTAWKQSNNVKIEWRFLLYGPKNKNKNNMHSPRINWNCSVRRENQIFVSYNIICTVFRWMCFTVFYWCIILYWLNCAHQLTRHFACVMEQFI